MDVKNLILGMVGIMICAVMIGGALLPAIATATDPYADVYNNTSEVYATTSTEVTLEFDNGTYTVDDETVDLLSYTRLIISDIMIVEKNPASATVFVWYNDTRTSFTATYLKLTYNEGSVAMDYTTSDTSGTITTEFKWIYYVNSIGDYRMFTIDSNGSVNAYVNSINDVVAVARGSNVIYSISDGITNTNGVQSNEGFYDLTSVDGYENLYTINITNNSDSDLYFKTGEYITYPGAVLVPFKIIGVKDGGTTINALFNAIPLIAVAGLVMAGIYVFINRK